MPLDGSLPGITHDHGKETLREDGVLKRVGVGKGVVNKDSQKSCMHAGNRQKNTFNQQQQQMTKKAHGEISRFLELVIPCFDWWLHRFTQMPKAINSKQ